MTQGTTVVLHHNQCKDPIVFLPQSTLHQDFTDTESLLQTSGSESSRGISERLCRWSQLPFVSNWESGTKQRKWVLSCGNLCKTSNLFSSQHAETQCLTWPSPICNLEAQHQVCKWWVKLSSLNMNYQQRNSQQWLGSGDWKPQTKSGLLPLGKNRIRPKRQHQTRTQKL